MMTKNKRDLSNIGPGQYEVPWYLDNVEIDKNIGTSQFMNPVGKAVEKIDPYDPLKAADKYSNSLPGPGHYQIEHHRTIQKSTERKVDTNTGIPQLTHEFVTDNTDWFGLPI